MSPLRVFRKARDRWQHLGDARLHTEADAALLRTLPSLLSDEERERVAARIRVREGRGLLYDRPLGDALAPWLAISPVDAVALREFAIRARRGTLDLYGHVYPVEGPSFDFDPVRRGRWPRAPHAYLRLDDARRPGDVRMLWESTRFHHAIALAYTARASDPGDPEAAFASEAFERQARDFHAASPSWNGVHWAVGMEVAIRASAWVHALEHIGAQIDEATSQLWVARLLLHGVFIEHHLERHPDGFTTNHTLADAAGLLLVARAFEGTEIALRWRRFGTELLQLCLREQVLPSGAHAEGSLVYERFALETALTAASALGEDIDSETVAAIARLAAHLEACRFGARLPHIGDSDESFFPPFGVRSFDRRDPLDPEHALRAFGAWRAALKRMTCDASDARNLPARLANAGDASPGLHTFEVGAFQGGLVHRAAGQGWMRTHGHNDLLSILLDIDGTPFLVDPGTGGYAVDRALRHALRSTSAHSTLQIEDEEQTPLRPAAIFEGPVVPNGSMERVGPHHLESSHDGFDGLRVHRALRALGARLVLTDRVFDRGRGATPLTSTLRFRLALGLSATLSHGNRIATVQVAAGEARLLLLHPRTARWQSSLAPASARYAERSEAVVLHTAVRRSLPHRWRVAIEWHPETERGAKRGR